MSCAKDRGGGLSKSYEVEPGSIVIPLRYVEANPDEYGFLTVNRPTFQPTIAKSV